jgi:hypothetical protein
VVSEVLETDTGGVDTDTGERDTPSDWGTVRDRDMLVRNRTGPCTFVDIVSTAVFGSAGSGNTEGMERKHDTGGISVVEEETMGGIPMGTGAA